jgi:hypothetical protein
MTTSLFSTSALRLALPLAVGCEAGIVDADTPRSSLITATATTNSVSPALNIKFATPGASSSFNTTSLDGCSFTSRDGKTFYMASSRPGGLGGIDIWVSARGRVDDPWGAPVNVGPPVNSTADDFCPTIDRDGHRFFFVSRRAIEGSCGGSDIYVTRLRGDGTYEESENLGCDVNSAFDEASPFPLPEGADGPLASSPRRMPRRAIGARLGCRETHSAVRRHRAWRHVVASHSR